MASRGPSGLASAAASCSPESASSSMSWIPAISRHPRLVEPTTTNRAKNKRFTGSLGRPEDASTYGVDPVDELAVHRQRLGGESAWHQSDGLGRAVKRRL